MDKHLALLVSLTGLLNTANVGIPLIFGAVAAISSIIKGLTGVGPSLPGIADLIEGTLGANDSKIRAEIARLKQLIGTP